MTSYAKWSRAADPGNRLSSGRRAKGGGPDGPPRALSATRSGSFWLPAWLVGLGFGEEAISQGEAEVGAQEGQ